MLNKSSSYKQVSVIVWNNLYHIMIDFTSRLARDANDFTFL